MTRRAALGLLLAGCAPSAWGEQEERPARGPAQTGEGCGADEVPVCQEPIADLCAADCATAA